jgi:hypothetical protein
MSKEIKPSLTGISGRKSPKLAAPSSVKPLLGLAPSFLMMKTK